MTTVHVRITGKVQGVGYRAWTLQTAMRRGLTGWVRNRIDGSVEAVFQGTEDQIHNMIEKCHEGPVFARVLQVISKYDADEPLFAGFQSQPTV